MNNILYFKIFLFNENRFQAEKLIFMYNTQNT